MGCWRRALWFVTAVTALLGIISFMVEGLQFIGGGCGGRQWCSWCSGGIGRPQGVYNLVSLIVCVAPILGWWCCISSIGYSGGTGGWWGIFLGVTHSQCLRCDGLLCGWCGWPRFVRVWVVDVVRFGASGSDRRFLLLLSRLRRVGGITAWLWRRRGRVGLPFRRWFVLRFAGDRFEAGSDRYPVEEEETAVGVAVWCSLLVVCSPDCLVPRAGVQRRRWFVGVLRRDEVDAVRWIVLVQDGYVDIHCGCYSVHEWYGGFTTVNAIVLEDGAREDAAGVVTWQWRPYVGVFGAEALRVEWVGGVTQHGALQHRCDVGC